MSIELRPIDEDEYEKWMKAAHYGFSEHVNDEILALRRPTVEMDRTLAAYDGKDIVGTSLAYSMQITVPGGVLPCAVLDAVQVNPTHRRRGILTQMMEYQLKDFHERGDTLAALEASESIIYGRFGYGVGSQREDWKIPWPHAAFANPPDLNGRLSLITPEEARRILPDVYERASSQRTGMLKFNDAWWDSFTDDPEVWRRGMTAFFHVVYEQDGRVDGYVSYRVLRDTLHIIQLTAVTDDAYARLWRYCFDVDLMSFTEARVRAVDEAIPLMLADPRMLQRSVRDGLWLRIVDVQAALSARSYPQGGHLVIEVRDNICGWNNRRFEIEAGPKNASCGPTDLDPDIVLSVADLAAVYLGAVTFRTLIQARRIEEKKTGATHLADAMFITQSKPWTPSYDLG